MKFSNVLEEVIARYTFQTLCDQIIPKISVGAWLENISDLNPTQITNFVARSMFAIAIFDYWADIVANLQDPRITLVDARDLCLRKLYDARMHHWVMSEQDRRNPAVVD